MNVDDVARVMRQNWSGRGLTARGRVLRAAGQDVHWVVVLDPLPHHRLGVDIGARLAGGSPKGLGDCGIVLHLENMPLQLDEDLVAALDLGSSCPDHRRVEVLSGATAALAEYVVARGTVASLGDSYRAGELQSAFIRADTRRVLESV